ncbi:DUF4380 domain-containing protein [Flavitalea antarctica]
MKILLIVATCSFILACTSQRAIPVNSDGVISVEIDNVMLEVDPATGARITALRYQGKNFLTGKDIHPDYWGSTLWPSPQKEWGGNPPPELDKQSYALTIDNKVIKMVSKKDEKYGYVFSKEIYGDKRNGSFNIRYTILNNLDQVRTVAPWEVTRVHTKGLAFYPKGTGERRGNLAGFAEDIDGITWFRYDEQKIPASHNKFFADGSEGWVAQVNDDLIFIKKFPDIPAEQAAPGESEIEVYTNPGKSYVEIEQQGAYETLQPGASLTWEVRWFLRKIPGNINRVPGSPDLVAFVRNVLEKQ